MAVVPTHATTTPDPAVLRWTVPDGLLPFTGTVAHAPGLLQALLEDGTLSGLEVVPGAVLTLLGPGRTWTTEGPRVQRALVDGLGTPSSWRPDQGALGVGPDDALRAAALEIAEGPVGDIAHLHGGSFQVREVNGGVVEVGLAGACHDCPAAVITMHARFEHLLRRRCPWLVEVREAAVS